MDNLPIDSGNENATHLDGGGGAKPEPESLPDLSSKSSHAHYTLQLKQLIQHGHKEEATQLADKAALLPSPTLPLLRQMLNVYKSTKAWDQALVIAELISFHVDLMDNLDLTFPSLLTSLGKYTESMSALELLSSKAVGNIESKILDCRNLLGIGALDRASSLARLIIKDYPFDWRGYDLLLDTLLFSSKPDEAAAVALECIGCSQLHVGSPAHQDSNANHVSSGLLPSPAGTLHVLQYYNKNPFSTQKATSAEQLKIYNLKLAMQWNASLGINGSYHLLGFCEAVECLESWHGPRAVDAFRKCKLPAMQADVVRVAFLAYFSHALYLDWPYRPIGRSLLLSNSLFTPSSCILAGKAGKDGWRVCNGFAYINGVSKVSAVFMDILEDILSNIESRSSNNVFKVTGPAVWYRHVSRLTELPFVERLFFPRDFNKYFQPVFNKRSDFDSHWSKVQEKESIYYDP